jgi:hypothetical protein
MGVHSLGVEFDSRETINHFTVQEWVDFKKSVDAVKHGNGTSAKCFLKDDEAACANLNWLKSPINGHDAIVTGLLGFDCAHTCYPELHPVFAMAIRLSEEGDWLDDRWLIFVQRAGNEGFCSQKTHILENLADSTYTFRLFPSPSSPGVSAEAKEQKFLTASGLAYKPVLSKPASGEGVLVSFVVPSTKEIIHGLLRLKWSSPGPGPGRPRPPPEIAGTPEVMTPGLAPALQPSTRSVPPGVGAPAPVLPAGGEAVRAVPTEAWSEQLVAKMTPAQRKVFFSKYPPERIAKHNKPPKSGKPPKAPAKERVGPPTVRSIPNPEQQKRDQQLLDALQAVYGPNIPSQPVIRDHR